MLLEQYPSKGYPEEGWGLPENVEIIENVQFAEVDGTQLHLDIVKPRREPEDAMPVVVWLHGGGWRWGNRRAAFERLFHLAASGYFCIASDYRLTGSAIFPAQIHDAKTVVRWIHAHQNTFHFNNRAIGIWGGSSGGHLAALLGLTIGHKDFNNSGAWQGFSDEVHAIVDFFGPTQLDRMDRFPKDVVSQMEHKSADSCEGRLIGGDVEQNPEVAKLASPMTYVTENAPPFLIMHGDKDSIVPIVQSEMLHKSLINNGVSSRFIVVRKGGHGANDWKIPYLETVKNFFDRELHYTPNTEKAP